MSHRLLLFIAIFMSGSASLHAANPIDALHEAIIKKDYDAIQKIMIDPSLSLKDAYSDLSKAIIRTHDPKLITFMQQFETRGLFITPTSDDLIEAVMRKDMDLLKALLAYHPSITTDVLVKAIEDNRFEMLKLLVADIKEPLHSLTFRYTLETQHWNHTGSHQLISPNFTLLHLAIFKEHYGIAKYLIEKDPALTQARAAIDAPGYQPIGEKFGLPWKGHLAKGDPYFKENDYWVWDDPEPFNVTPLGMIDYYKTRPNWKRTFDSSFVSYLTQRTQ